MKGAPLFSRPGEMRFTGPAFCFPLVHKTLSMEKKRGLILLMCAGPNDAIRLVPVLGEKGFSSAWSDLKDAGESGPQILFDNNAGGEWGGKMPS